MKIMKNKWFKSALLAVAGMSMTSCGDFLEIYPLTMVYEDNYWNEKNDVDQIVTGCYTRMQDDDFLRRLFIWGESRSDNTRRGFRSSFSATSNEGYILSENILSTNGYTDWSSFYSVIDRCNLVIERAPQVAEVDPNYLPSDVQATIAEVTALRSLCYFYLVRAFKDVPYYTEAITNDEQELNLPATDGDVIVRTLIQDLLTVYPNALRVWPKQNGVDISYGRITQDAILAMVEQGLGVSIMPELVLRDSNRRFSAIPLDHPRFREIGLAVRSGKAPSPLTSHFLSCVQELVAQMDPDISPE